MYRKNSVAEVAADIAQVLRWGYQIHGASKLLQTMNNLSADIGIIVEE